MNNVAARAKKAPNGKAGTVLRYTARNIKPNNVPTIELTVMVNQSPVNPKNEPMQAIKSISP